MSQLGVGVMFTIITLIIIIVIIIMISHGFQPPCVTVGRESWGALENSSDAGFVFSINITIVIVISITMIITNIAILFDIFLDFLSKFRVRDFLHFKGFSLSSEFMFV